MPHLEHFLSAEDGKVAEIQETKRSSPISSPDEAGSLTESVSTSKEETIEVKKTTENQTEVADNGKIYLFL